MENLDFRSGDDFSPVFYNENARRFAKEAKYRAANPTGVIDPVEFFKRFS